MASPLAAQHAGAHHHAANDAGARADGREMPLAAELERVREANRRYQDIEAARADGFVRFGRSEGPLMGEHWFRRDLVDRPFDLERPSTLQYAVIDGERVLVGVAYTVYRRPEDPVPEGFTGDADIWHVHDVEAIARAVTAERPLLNSLVRRGLERGRIAPGGRTQLTMLHAWVWSDNPDGVFADQHRGLPYLRAGLPSEYVAAGNAISAEGVALLLDSACEAEVRRIDAAVRLGRSRRRALEEACERSGERVRGARELPPVEFNREAERAWLEYAEERARVLTPVERERLAGLRAEHVH